MYLAFPSRNIERRIVRSLEIIIEFLRRLGNDLAGLELVRGGIATVGVLDCKARRR